MATIMRLVGIPYQDGHYASIFPAQGELVMLREQLQTRYPAIFSVGVSTAIEQEVLDVRAREQNHLSSRYFANEPTLFCE